MLQHTMINTLEINNKSRMLQQRKHLAREIEDIKRQSNGNFRNKPFNYQNKKVGGWKGQWMGSAVEWSHKKNRSRSGGLTIEIIQSLWDYSKWSKFFKSDSKEQEKRLGQKNIYLKLQWRKTQIWQET